MSELERWYVEHLKEVGRMKLLRTRVEWGVLVMLGVCVVLAFTGHAGLAGIVLFLTGVVVGRRTRILGFTRADVARLRQFSGTLSELEWGAEHAEPLRDLAKRIESSLPPEVT